MIDVRFGTGGATLSLPLEEISLYRVCQAVDPEALDKMIGIHFMPSPLCPVGKNIKPVLNHTYDRVKQDMIRSMQEITLNSILEDYHAERAASVQETL